MKRRIALCRVLALCLICWCVLAISPLSARDVAADTSSASNVALVPLDAPGFVQVASVVLAAELSSEASGSTIQVHQTYQLRNRDLIEGALLHLGLAGLQPAMIALKDDQGRQYPAQGTELPPIGDEAQDRLAWEVSLQPNERKTLILSYPIALPSAYFVQWQWDMSPLSAWGTIESARIAFKLPQLTTDDAFLKVEPHPFRFDGSTLCWEYEQIKTPARHVLTMLSPRTWQYLRALRATGAHYELAHLYMTLDEAAQVEGVPFGDHFEQITAALLATLDASPENTEAHLDLARLYRTKADGTPDLRLNYLLLAARELATAHAQRPTDQQLADSLARTYYEAAITANEMGDPSGALAYLKKASQVQGARLEQEGQTREELTLHWALDLAERGQVTEALGQLEEVLSPRVKDTLVRYAPPFVSSRTEVALTPNGRTASYQLQLYPPSASRTRARLQEIAMRLERVAGVKATIEPAPDHADAVTFAVQLSARSLSGIQDESAKIANLLSEDVDLVSALVAAPWQATLRTYALEENLWYARYLYQESIDLASVQNNWETESQYARWRTIELRDASPSDARAALEQRLSLIALQEQRQIWDHLPSGSYWVYRVTYENPLEPPLAWLLSYGQARELESTYLDYHWRSIAITASLLLCLILWVVCAAHRRHRL